MKKSCMILTLCNNSLWWRWNKARPIKKTSLRPYGSRTHTYILMRMTNRNLIGKASADPLMTSWDKRYWGRGLLQTSTHRPTWSWTWKWALWHKAKALWIRTCRFKEKNCELSTARAQECRAFGLECSAFYSISILTHAVQLPCIACHCIKRAVSVLPLNKSSV